MNFTARADAVAVADAREGYLHDLFRTMIRTSRVWGFSVAGAVSAPPGPADAPESAALTERTPGAAAWMSVAAPGK